MAETDLSSSSSVSYPSRRDTTRALLNSTTAFSGPESGSGTIKGAVQDQLAALASWSGLPPEAAVRLWRLVESYAGDALDQPIGSSFPGLSAINADGLPFQWSFSFPGDRAVRFVTENGPPGQPVEQRAFLALERLTAVCWEAGIGEVTWLQSIARELLPDQRWPAHWRSAVWLGVGAAGTSIGLKPYFNLNRDPARWRWLRVGRILTELGRGESLRQLCAMSGHVSHGSWPVGLAADVRPDGTCGRIKVYFRSDGGHRGWLRRWAENCGAERHLEELELLLAAFTPDAGKPYPTRAFVVSPEFHPSGAVSFKVDLAVTRWLDQAGINRGLHWLTDRLGFGGVDEMTASAELAAAAHGQSAEYRFVGWGCEPDGKTHLNVYVEPPIWRR